MHDLDLAMKTKSLVVLTILWIEKCWATSAIAYSPSISAHFTYATPTDNAKLCSNHSTRKLTHLNAVIIPIALIKTLTEILCEISRIC